MAGDKQSADAEATVQEWGTYLLGTRREISDNASLSASTLCPPSVTTGEVRADVDDSDEDLLTRHR